MPGDDAEKSAPTSSSAVEEQEDDDMDQVTPESRKLYPIVHRHATAFFKFIFSHRMIPLLKGTFTATNHFVFMHLN